MSTVKILTQFAFISNQWIFLPSDGTSVGISLDGASPEDLAKLDQLLSQLADLKTVDVSATVEKKKEAEKKKEEVVGGVTEDKEQPTWGTTIAGVSGRGVGKDQLD